MQNKWTKELALVEAVKYDTHEDMSKHNDSLYKWLTENGLSWAIGAHKEYVGDYVKYSNIVKRARNLEELNSSYPKIMYWAKHNGYYDKFVEIVGQTIKHNSKVYDSKDKLSIPCNVTKDGNWNKQSAMAEALKYDFSYDMLKNNKELYDWLTNNKLSWVIGAHKDHPNCYPAFTAFARRTPNLATLIKQRPDILYWAKHNGYYDEIVSMVGDRRGSSYDAIYIWKAVGVEFNGKQVYKLGLTSYRLKDKRIKDVAKGANLKYEIVILEKVLKADFIEYELLQFGENPKLGDFDGSSEFRALTNVELLEAIKTVKDNRDNEYFEYGDFDLSIWS